MDDIYWTVHTESTNSPFYVNALTAEWPNHTITGTARIRLWINDEGTLVVESGETYTVESGTTEFFEAIDVDGTLIVNGTLIVESEENRFETLAQYGDYAGQSVVERTINHVPWFVEQLPSDARVDSIVMGFEPSQTLKDRNVRGLWGILEGFTDERNSPLTNHQVEYQISVLDEFAEYADVSAVKTALEA